MCQACQNLLLEKLSKNFWGVQAMEMSCSVAALSVGKSHCAAGMLLLLHDTFLFIQG